MPLLKTKTFTPRVPEDLVSRPRLLDLLRALPDRCLTMVSAPAGYGKSTLAAHWLADLDCRKAWISLDTNDNDPTTFLTYFVAALRMRIPAACPQTQDLLRAPILPPLSVVLPTLINDLTTLDLPTVLVLDDYHLINDRMIHELVEGILIQDIPGFHVVILTRSDPPLALSAIRASGRMVELRLLDLQFRLEEAQSFLSHLFSDSLNPEDVRQLHGRTEGWPVGLRLAALSLRNHQDQGGFIKSLSTDSRHIQEYLISEVLAQQDPEVRICLMETSILGRMCGSLCEAVCSVKVAGGSFVHRVHKSGLFAILLDEKEEWARYHHIFQEMLLRSLKRQNTPQEIAALHGRAGAWFDSQGLWEEAIEHYLAGGDPMAAARTVSICRHELMNREQWHLLIRLLAMIPEDVIVQSPGLLLARAWFNIGFSDMDPILDKVEGILSENPEAPEPLPVLRGELACLRGLQHYSSADVRQARAQSESALLNLAYDRSSERGFAVIVHAMARQMDGDQAGAVEMIQGQLHEMDRQGDTYHCRLLAALCFMYWIDGDLGGLMPVARQYHALGEKHHLLETIDHGLFFLGVSHYLRNELPQAEGYLGRVVHAPFLVNFHNYTHASFALAGTLEALGRSDEARRIVENLMVIALDRRNQDLMELVEAYRADLAHRQGVVGVSRKWARKYAPTPLRAGLRFYYPQLTLLRVLLDSDRNEDIGRAGVLVQQLEKFFESTNNNRHLLEVFVWKARLQLKLGDIPAARKSMALAVRMAGPEGIIRPFLDSGPGLEPLCHVADWKVQDRPFIKDLVSGIPPGRELAGVAKGSSTLVEPLTSREEEILAFLARRLTNLEVAERLFISPATVKRHTSNLYKKLEVHDRRQAVDKAVSLGMILPD